MSWCCIRRKSVISSSNLCLYSTFLTPLIPRKSLTWLLGYAMLCQNQSTQLETFKFDFLRVWKSSNRSIALFYVVTNVLEPCIPSFLSVENTYAKRLFLSGRTKRG